MPRSKDSNRPTPIKGHRYNGGDLIPPTAVDAFVNWQYALDEEGEEGQDESTIKPTENQHSLDKDYVCLTAGTATFADGSTVPVLIDFGYAWDGDVDSIQAIRFLGPTLSDQPWLDLTLGGVNLEQSKSFFARYGDMLPVTVVSRLQLDSGDNIRLRLDAGAYEVVYGS